MKRSEKVEVKNLLGLHARPAAVISRLLQQCKSKVFFTYRGETINARSIMSILMLAAGKNSQIVIETEGEDAELTLSKLIYAFETGFGEEEIEL